MTAFSDRCRGYQTGLLLLAASLVLTVVGFSVPSWGTAFWNPGDQRGSHTSEAAGAQNESSNLTQDEPDDHEGQQASFREGLWVSCWATGRNGTSQSCRSSIEWAAPSWMKLVRVLECGCLLAVGTASFYAVVVNFCRTIPGPRSRVIEGLSLCSGVLGMSGAVTYLALIGRQDVQQLHFQGHLDDHYPGLAWSPAWALHVTLAGHVVTLLAACVVCVFNRPPRDATPSTPITSTASVATTTTTTATAAPTSSRHG